MLGALELRRRAKAAASKRESFCRPHGNAVPVAAIETLDVFVVPFNEVPTEKTGSVSSTKPVAKRGRNPCLISASPARTNRMQRLVGLLVRAEYLPYGVNGWTALAEVVAGC